MQRMRPVPHQTKSVHTISTPDVVGLGYPYLVPEVCSMPTAKFQHKRQSDGTLASGLWYRNVNYASVGLLGNEKYETLNKTNKKN